MVVSPLLLRRGEQQLLMYLEQEHGDLAEPILMSSTVERQI